MPTNLSNGVVERLNRKNITCLRTLINPHSILWGTWIPHVTCSLNTHINAATGETPHYILFGEDKNFPCSLMESESRQTYNYDDFIVTRVNKFNAMYQRVRENMQQYSQDLKKQQYKRARTIKIQLADIVMVKQLHTPVSFFFFLFFFFTSQETAQGQKKSPLVAAPITE